MVTETTIQTLIPHGGKKRDLFGFAPGFFEGKPRSIRTQNNQYLKERTPTAPNHNE
jgi:hypothetical protein